MERYGIPVEAKNIPALDPEFIPILKFNRAFMAGAERAVSIAVERADGQIATTHTFIHGSPEMADADRYYIDRLVKTELWMKGGYKVYVNDKDIYEYLCSVYCEGGERAFDWEFMADVFENPFQVIYTEEIPETLDKPVPMGGHLEGCRIRFDAGGSARKVSAVIDCETVFCGEVFWLLKINLDPEYH